MNVCLPGIGSNDIGRLRVNAALFNSSQTKIVVCRGLQGCLGFNPGSCFSLILIIIFSILKANIISCRRDKWLAPGNWKKNGNEIGSWKTRQWDLLWVMPLIDVLQSSFMFSYEHITNVNTLVNMQQPHKKKHKKTLKIVTLKCLVKEMISWICDWVILP